MAHEFSLDNAIPSSVINAKSGSGISVSDSTSRADDCVRIRWRPIDNGSRCSDHTGRKWRNKNWRRCDHDGRIGINRWAVGSIETTVVSSPRVSRSTADHGETE